MSYLMFYFIFYLARGKGESCQARTVHNVHTAGACEKTFLLREPWPLQSTGRNCSPAPELAL